MISGTAAYIVTRLEQEMERLPDPHNEIIQHLIELAYIPVQKANAMRSADVFKAKAQCLADIAASLLFDSAYLEKLLLIGEDFALKTLLRKICDIDQGLVIKTLPQGGESDLIARMIHYRLDVFGLWPRDVATPFSSFSLYQLGLIADFAKCTALQAFNFLGDVEQFTRYLLQIHPPEKFILIFQSPKVSDETKNKLDRRHAFKRQLIEDFGERSDFIKFLAHEILKNNPKKVDVLFLQKQANDPFKQFMLRLIQVHQWQDGFYGGLLDSDIGEVSLKSITDAIGFYNATDKRDIKTHRVITYVHRGYFVFNSLFFLQEYMIEDAGIENQSLEEKVLAGISTQLETANEGDRASFMANIDQLKKESYLHAAEPPQERKGLLQRIYFGTKRLLSKAFRFVHKIYGWVKDKIVEMWGFLKSLFRNFFEQLQTGIRAFLEGIGFMFGNKTIESAEDTEAIATKFSLDSDAVSISTKSIAAVHHGHTHKVRYKIRSLEFSLAVVGGILKMAISMVNVLTWPLLLFRIIKIFQDISASYMELSKIEMSIQ